MNENAPALDDDLSFTCKNRRGDPVRYEVHPHPTREGLRIVQRLLALAGGPLAAGLGTLVGGVEGKTAADLLDAPLDAVGGSVAGLGEAVAAAIRTADLDNLYPAIMRYATRDGVPLDSVAAFDAAYARNFGELHDAAIKVCAANGFFSLPDISGLLKRKPRPTPPSGSAAP